MCLRESERERDWERVKGEREGESERERDRLNGRRSPHCECAMLKNNIFFLHTHAHPHAHQHTHRDAQGKAYTNVLSDSSLSTATFSSI